MSQTATLNIDLASLERFWEAEVLAREGAALAVDPLEAELDWHDHVRDHAQNLYQHALSGLLGDYGRRAHRKLKAAQEGQALALFLLLLDDFDDDFEEVMKTTGAQAYAYSEDALGGSAWGQPEERSRAYAESRLPAMAKAPEGIKKRLAASLERAVAEGQSPLALARRVDEAIAEVEGFEVERIAAVESQVVYGVTQDAALKMAGFELKRWVSQRDGAVRPTHVECDAQGAIPIGKVFLNSLRYPGDPNGPIEEVANCRCFLVGERRAGG